MNRHALSVLEFGRVLELVAERATSALGAAAVRALHPADDRAYLEAEHRRVAAMRALMSGEGGWAPEPVPNLREGLARLRVEGAGWSARELLDGAILLRSSRLTRDVLRDDRRPAMARAVLEPFADALVEARALEDRIARTIAEDGTVRDDASPALRKIRRELREAEGQLVRILEGIMRRLEPHQRVEDASVTVRNGRWVIPVRRGAQVTVGGIVHDTSSTGNTMFVEPPAAVEFGNRIRELESEEQREVERILRELTAELRPRREELVAALEALVALDSLFARARFAFDFRCAPAELCLPHEGFHLRDGRHPLLLAQGQPVTPFDLQMLPEERTLLVSGPNTGGKTVLLKAIGLMSALAQSGIPAPVGEESRIAVFDDVFADVGDEQSIQASLSTFSAHLRNLGEILGAATERSLVLVDELGSGTDPLEGASLGGAILEELTRRGTLTLASTHLGALKELATEVPGVVNASLAFDAERLAPTYRLVKGVPGRSYGLSIARRLGLPEDVLVRAEERLPSAERDYAALLADLEKRADAMAAREAELAVMHEAHARKSQSLADRERSVRGREIALERESRSEARKYLLEARKEIDRTIKALKEQGAVSLDEAAREARRQAETLAAAQGEALERVDRRERKERERQLQRPAEPRAGGAPLAEGDYVEVVPLGHRAGRIMSLRDSTAVVAMGSVKMSFPVAQLKRGKAPAGEVQVVLRGDMPEVHAPSEIDVRGMRAHEVDDAVMRALDQAIRADLKAIRIIHGKGTGALRERVTEMIAKDTRIRGHRLGAWNEGGTGVTVVEL